VPNEGEQDVTNTIAFVIATNPSNCKWKHIQFHVDERLHVNVDSTEMCHDNLEPSCSAFIVLSIELQK
jgi:hypothetical protein